MNISKLMYFLQRRGVRTWLCQNDQIKVAIPANTRNRLKQRLIRIIKENKKNIIDVLLVNKIYSEHNIPHILRLSSKESIPLSFSQQRLWFLYKYQDKQSHVYNEPVLLVLNQKINLSALAFGLTVIIRKHDIFRTLLKEDADGDPKQVIIPIEEIPAVKFLVESIEKSKINEVLRKEANYHFDLANEMPIKIRLFKIVDDSKYILSITQHHFVTDGRSRVIFSEEIAKYYQSFLDGNEELDLVRNELQYADFSVFQREYFKGKLISEQLAYWKTKLYQFETLQLPTDRSRPNIQTYSGERIEFKLPSVTVRGLRKISQETQSSMFMVLLSGFYIVLSRYSGQHDLVLGTPIANRQFPQLDDIIGFFSNSLALRANTSGHTVLSFIRDVKEMCLSAYEHQDLPFELLIQELEVPRDLSRAPIFQVMFALQNSAENVSLELGNTTIPLTQVSHTTAKFDLLLHLAEEASNDEIGGYFEFNTDLFFRQTIEIFVQIFMKILSEMIEYSDYKLENLQLLTAEHYREIIYNRNVIVMQDQTHKTIHQIFEENVKNDPYRIAVVFSEEELTYAQLNSKANKLARYLTLEYQQQTGKAIEPGTLISLYYDRGFEMIVAILAVLKSGAAYVALDPKIPHERIESIFQDAGCKFLLTQKSLQLNLNAIKRRGVLSNFSYLVTDSTDTLEQLKKMSEQNLNSISREIDLAYVIYTSGTTGKPKGVMQPHKNIIRLFSSTEKWFRFNEKDIWLFFHSYVFDFSVWELWGAILNGGHLVIPTPQQTLDFNLLYELCSKKKVTILNLTPTAFYQFCEIAQRKFTQNKLSQLRCVIFGGEKLIFSKLVTWCDMYGVEQPELINMYGITEITVHATYRKIQKDDLNDNVSRIGNVLPDLSAYVLDSSLNPMPAGAIGGLYIGGTALARGYLNAPKLTATKFIKNPFQTESEKAVGINNRLYKTGDLVKWLPDDSLAYIGRNDTQVKVRGFRIELGEIEATLSSYSVIKHGVVVLKSERLVGYYVADDDLDADNILAYLGCKLPEYMLPAALVRLDRLPLTVNGKLDEASLPEPEFTDVKGYVEPSNELEQKLCSLWEDILGLSSGTVGIRDDFFRLGGNSILAIKLTNVLNRVLSVSIGVVTLFKYRTIEKLGQNLDDADALSVNIVRATFKHVEEQKLSFSQERLWFIDRYEKGTNAYNISAAYQLGSSVNVSAVKAGLEHIVRRHEILRTLIKENAEGNSYQQILDIPLEVEEQSVSSREELLNLLNQAANYRYKLDAEYPLRICIYYLNDVSFLGITIHHIAFDGWSIDIFLSELYECYKYYDSQSKGLTYPLNLPILPIQYKDFAVWQRNYMTGDELAKQLSYWRDKLVDYENLSLIPDNARPLQVCYTGKDIAFEISEALSDDLKALAKELKVSLYSVLLSGYYLLLSSYSGQTDLVVGIPVANRHYSQVESLIGCFVNSLAIRMKLNSNSMLRDYIQEVGQSLVQGQLHQDLPFEKLVEELDVVKDGSRHPVFQTMFILQSFGRSSYDDLMTDYEDAFGCEIAKFDLSVFIDDSGKKLSGIFNYATSLYDKQTILSFIKTYKQILSQLIEINTANNKANLMKLSDINYLTASEYKQLIYDWNETQKSYPLDSTIHELFKAQVSRTPDNIAISYKDKRLTYRELDIRSNQLAHYLKSQVEIHPDDLMILCLDRSEQLLISLLAILKSGGAYVPLDPSYPDERLGYVLADTASKVVLTNKEYRERFINIIGREAGVAVLSVDDTSIQAAIDQQPVNAPELATQCHHLAYVIYTSGTMGKPKGVMLEHGACINRIYEMATTSGLVETDVILFKTNIVFDVSFTDIFVTLHVGASLIMTEESFNFDEIKVLLDTHKVTVSHFTPTQFEMVQDGIEADVLKKIRVVHFSGEALYLSYFKSFSKYSKYLNYYGPTETGEVTCSNITDRTHRHISVIGQALGNIKLFVLDSSLNPMPAGAIGGLYIGGIALARGYLNAPKLTATKFIKNPFQTESEKAVGINNRLYKTGDLVKWLPDDSLAYIGRNDTQVKVRGFRIELGEIEATLSSYSVIKHGVVVLKSERLVGYYVADDDLDADNILAYLGCKLPEYMLPAALVRLDRLPLTVNGKLDEASLPEPEFTDVKGYVEPSNELEQKLCSLWEDILGLSSGTVGIRDDFFRLGGNSILAIKLTNVLNRVLSVSIGVVTLFKYRTIEKLGQNLDDADALSVNIVRATFKHVEEQKLSFSQERLWFIDRYEKGTNAYNISAAYQLGSSVNVSAVKAGLEHIVRRHEILRTLIKENAEGNSYQQILDIPLEVEEQSVSSREELLNLLNQAANYRYKLDAEYPLRICIYYLNDVSFLGITIHHIAFDGWSIDIFLSELYECYKYYDSQSKGLTYPLNLPILPIQYKDFAVWQRNYMTGDELAKQLSYWRDKLVDYENLSLIPDNARPLQVCYTGKDIAFEISEALSDDLKALAKELKVSLYSVLLSGYYLLLSSYSGQTDLVVGIPVANRHYSQVESLIGCFVNSLAIRMKLNSNSMLRDYIQEVGQSLVQGQLHQDLPFEKLVEELDVVKDGSRHPVFQTMFILQSFGRSSYDDLMTDYEDAFGCEIAKFDLSVFIDDSGKKLSGIFNYATSLYDKQTILSFIKTYKQILSQLIEINTANNKANLMKLSDINYLTASEYKQLIYDWNETQKSYPLDSTIHELFKAQVSRTPDNIAISYKDKRLTYRELDIRSNQLAHYLKSQVEIHPDDLMILCLDRSEQLLISLLAILKSGGAYVPLDPSYPDERLGYVLADTASKVVLTNKEYRERFINIIGREAGVAVLSVDDTSIQAAIDQQPVNAPELATQCHHLAYVIYTSGTMGKPKGVMLEHRSIVNYVYSISGKYIDIEKVDFSSNIAFDLTVTTTIFPLLTGKSIYIYQDLLINALAYVKHLNINKIELIKSTPTFLYNIPSEALAYKLKVCILGGEKLTTQMVNQILNFSDEVVDEYGPTETTVGVTQSTSTRKETKHHIGKPYPNCKLYLLNNSLKPVGFGALGELYIGGVGLARGYLNVPKLTASKFIKNPFQTKSEKVYGINSRLYKTGDLVRWLQDGSLEYLGRKDTQVKIRGYRVELEEVEKALLSHNDVTRCVVVTKSRHATGDKVKFDQYLAGYYVSENKVDEDLILECLRRKLPEHMIPNALVHVSKIPLTINGKLDKQALPEPELFSHDNYVAPRNKLEQIICDIWGKVLGIPSAKISIHDDFFKMGGDSILSMLLLAQMRKSDIHLSIKDIFECRTIEKLYALLRREASFIASDSERGILQGGFALLPIQQWFFEQVEHGQFPLSNYWNQSFLIKTPMLSIPKLNAVIIALTEHHDMLRTTFLKDKNGQYIQQYNKSLKIPEIKMLNIQTLADLNELAHIFTRWQAEFDLQNGPLWQLGYIDGYKDGSARLFFSLHHLIVDTVSMRILTEDIRTLYYDEKLLSKTTSFRQWVNVVQDYATKYSKEIKYWSRIQLDQIDYSSYKQQMIQHIEFQLTLSETKHLTSYANRAYHTQINDLLLTAVAYGLTEWNKSNTNHLCLERHGRERISDSSDLSRTVGWFTTIYPIKLLVKSSLNQTIKYVKESLRQVPNDGIGYGALKFSNKKEERISGGVQQIKKLPLITFNYLGQFNAQGAMWEVTDESSGISMPEENLDANIININSAILNGKFIFRINTKISETETTLFADKLKNHLQKIIQHCVTRVNNKTIEKTPSDFKAQISQQLLDKLQLKASSSGKHIHSIYPANSLQRGFIYHALHHEGDDSYRVQILFDYANLLNVENYRKAWSFVIQIYPALRTSFNWDEGIIQIIYTEGKLNFSYYDISSYPKQRQAREIRRIQKNDRGQSFNLTEPSLLRLTLIKRADEHYTLLKSEHHSISDGWSWPVLLDKVHQIYRSLQNGSFPTTEAETCYIAAQEYYLSQKEVANKYWHEQVRAGSKANDLNALLTQRVNLNDFRTVKQFKQKKIILKGKLYQNLKGLTLIEGVTLNTLLQFAWHKLIQIYTGDGQTIVGSTVSGRNIPIDGIENSVGLFINTLPLMIDWVQQSSITIREQLVKISQRMTELNHYCYGDLSSLQKSGQRLFHSLLVFESYPTIRSRNDEQIKINMTLTESIEKLDYSLCLVAYEETDMLTLELKYAGEHLSTSQATCLLKQVRSILNQLLDCDSKISSINLLTPQEYQKVVYDYNKINVAQNRQTINTIFETQVEKFPDHIAIIYEDNEVSYRQLNAKANQLANYLIRLYGEQADQEFQSGTFIALCLNRSIEMIISILAVLKISGSYVPIDPNCPSERLSFILKDTCAAVIITQESFQLKFNNMSPSSLLFIDNEEVSAALNNLPDDNLNCRVQFDDLAYVIYTSGTTGYPKGVLQTHANVARLFTSTNDYFQFDSHDVWTLFHSYTFDFTVWEMWGALFYGGKLIIPNQSQVHDTVRFYTLCHRHQVTVLSQTPIAFYQFIDTDANDTKNEKITSLRYIIFGGDKLNVGNLKNWIHKYGYNQPRLINMYGITETTVHVTLKEISHKDLLNPTCSNIGKPLSDLVVYILDHYQNPVPHGIVGELYIGGAGLAKGYLNLPEETVDKFITKCFSPINQHSYPDAVSLYKTGDLAKWKIDGTIEYIGRNDSQVKIRGFRIELEEIENALLQISEVRHAVVRLKERKVLDGVDQYLIAYYVSDISAQLTESAIKHELALKLPAYMVPNFVIALNEIPLTVHGKLNIESLPVPKFMDQPNSVAPSTELEQQLCHIWQEVLGVEKVGITDDFFEIGGNSILAIRLMSKINKYFKVFLKVSDIFVCSNVLSIVPRILKSKKGYNCVVKLNNTSTKANIFMIHPGIGGSEVYAPLAAILDDCFSCYGIDSYNLYYEDNISDLKKLSEYYISCIDEIMKKTSQDTYYLLGWSLGGVIALEIAALLEERGHSNIIVYLLDVGLLAEGSIPVLEKLESQIEQEKMERKQQMLKLGFVESYTEKMIKNMYTENKLMLQKISSNIGSTDVILFKAMLDKKTDGAYQQGLSYYYNIDNIHNQPCKIKVIELSDVNHGTILQAKQRIKNIILESNERLIYDSMV